MFSANHLGPMSIWGPSSFSCLGSKRTKKHFFRNCSLYFHTYQDLCIGFLLWSLLPHDEGFKRYYSCSSRLWMLIVFDYVFRIILPCMLSGCVCDLLLWRCLLYFLCPSLWLSWTSDKFSFQKLVNDILYQSMP